MEKKEKKTDRLKGWYNRNREVILGWGFIAGVGAVYVGCIATIVHFAKVQNAEWEAQVKDALETGKTIVPQKDGSFFILDKTNVTKVELVD